LGVTFRDRHIERVGHPRLDLLDDTTLPLQGVIFREEQRQFENTDHHNTMIPGRMGLALPASGRARCNRYTRRSTPADFPLAGVSLRITCSVSKASIVSPTLTSA